ncbi:hypothetical protein HYN51_11750 [Limnobaculum parvum]|uniref:Uncharacterized protein n=1 Tax=Limnobaculum parvum TaxID=2172103 RepID=A0A2Y9TZQ1_9GAMM|nr:hypothetical protein HYN51_11750 [Limnobaculum parvum]
MFRTQKRVAEFITRKMRKKVRFNNARSEFLLESTNKIIKQWGVLPLPSIEATHLQSVFAIVEAKYTPSADRYRKLAPCVSNTQ